MLRRSLLRSLVVTLACVTMSLGATRARAQGAPAQESQPSPEQIAEAESLFRRGVDMAAQQRWGEAAAYFRRARALAERPSVVCNLGFALYRLGAATEAVGTLEDCLALAHADPAWERAHAQELATARENIEALREAVAHLELTLDPADAEVLIDGRARTETGAVRRLALDPGEHEVMVRAPGFDARTEPVSVLSGQSLSRSITLTATRADTLVVGGHEDAPPEHGPIGPPASDPASDPLLWVGVGVGVLAIGAVIAVVVVLSQPSSDPNDLYGGPVDHVFQPLVRF